MRQEAIQRQRKPVYVSGIDCVDSYHSCHRQPEPTSYSEKLQVMWIALLSSTLGYMMPSPSVKNMVPVLKK